MVGYGKPDSLIYLQKVYMISQDVMPYFKMEKTQTTAIQVATQIEYRQPTVTEFLKSQTVTIL